MSPSRLPVSSVEVMSEFGGQAAKGLLMGEFPGYFQIRNILKGRTHPGSILIYLTFENLEKNITPVVRGCFVHSTSHLGFGPRSPPAVGI